MNATSFLDPWPWSLPAVRPLDDLALDPVVTFIVGQNGSGTSTLVEGIAVAAGARGRPLAALVPLLE